VTFANLITMLRFLLVPAIIYALMTGYTGLAFAGFIVAGISDGIDGLVARHFNQRSELGTYLDPLADKLLLVSVCAVLLSTVMAHPVAMRPIFVSKANTAVQIVLAALVLAELAFSVAFGPARQGLVILSGILTAASTAAYFVSWLKHMGGYAKSK
jgi:cardiolipin synthase